MPNVPPDLGTAVRSEWALDPDFVTVNHGSFGATPRRVLAAQDFWRARMEAQPTRFMATILPEALRSAASDLAGFVGADAANLAFVENATTGCNAVLRSMALRRGDRVVVLAHGYGAVHNAVRHVTERAGTEMVEVAMPFPDDRPEGLVARLVEVLDGRTRLAVLDHITSQSALLLPLRDMIAACHAAGVPVLVDGAHAPGQVPLALEALGADWYVGNCHKWLMAPKGCGFLYARADRQEEVHPVTISHGFGGGFLAEFDWTGTIDFTAYLAVTEAIAFHCRLGGSALWARNARMAAEAAFHVAARVGGEALVRDGLSMSLVRLPLGGPVSGDRARAFRSRLLVAGADAPVHALDDLAWLRLSAQAYNTADDYERLAAILVDLLLEDAATQRLREARGGGTTRDCTTVASLPQALGAGRNEGDSASPRVTPAVMG